MTARRVYTKCQHDGCTAKDAEEWSICGYDPEPVFVYCTEHAAEAGFCLWCGNFIGGTEDVFLTGQTGLCFECFMEMEAEQDRAYTSAYDDDDEQELP